MGLFSKSSEEKAAVERMKAADKALNDYGAKCKKRGIDYETPEYQRLNRAANEAAAKVPFRFGGTKR